MRKSQANQTHITDHDLIYFSLQGHYWFDLDIMSLLYSSNSRRQAKTGKKTLSVPSWPRKFFLLSLFIRSFIRTSLVIIIIMVDYWHEEGGVGWPGTVPHLAASSLVALFPWSLAPHCKHHRKKIHKAKTCWNRIKKQFQCYAPNTIRGGIIEKSFVSRPKQEKILCLSLSHEKMLLLYTTNYGSW